MSTKVRKMCILAMLSALAYVAMFVSRFLPPMLPIIPFLKYDPKDIIITIGGFLYGPLAALMVTTVVALLEMVTVSSTGPIGLVMNIVSGCSFACTAAFIYKWKRSLKGAIIGLVAAWLFTTAVMVMWNYLITPIFMNVPRSQIAGLLIPAFIPFNLIKGGLNAAFTMLLYKPVKAALQASNIMPVLTEPAKTGKINVGVIIASVFVIVTCMLWVLVLQGRL